MEKSCFQRKEKSKFVIKNPLSVVTRKNTSKNKYNGDGKAQTVVVDKKLKINKIQLPLNKQSSSLQYSKNV